LTRGGDEVIETLIKAFTTPYKSTIAITNPTFSCYKIFAEINGVETIDIPLNTNDYLPD
jgi:histidinol-phosphate/aromatic aminotransferase/cobyric acid decarboxylase-like protein